MITVNSLSGGKTSSYMAIHYPADINIFALVCIDDQASAPKDPAILKYVLDKFDGNFIASAEHEKTLRVMMQLEQKIGQTIVWVRGESFDHWIKKKSIPNRDRRWCTDKLKMTPISQYTYTRYGKVLMNIGLRGDEFERREKIKNNIFIDFIKSSNIFGNRLNNHEEIEWREIGLPLEKTFHHEIIKYWSANKDFDFPNDSNCRFCFWKKKEMIKKNYIETPEQLLWASSKEGKYTWQDDKVTYDQIFKMNFTEEIDFANWTSCDSGSCTD